MNKGLIIGSLTIVLSAGGIIVGTSSNKGESLDGSITQEMDETLSKPKEKDMVQAIYGNRNNKPMRIIGEIDRTSSIVVDSELGRVIETSVVPTEARCVSIFEAPVKNGSNPAVPTMPAFGDFDGKEMLPVQIPGSNQGVNWIWFTMLRGQDCVTMAQHGQFLGSDLQSVLKLPAPMQRRILKAEVPCGGASTGTCVVPIDDARVTNESLIFLPAALAGRNDLNFVSKRAGKIESRVEEPDGGWEDSSAILRTKE